MPGEEFVDAVDGMRGDAGEHVAQPGERVDAVQLAGLDQTIDGGGTLSAGIRTGEEPIFPAEGDAADGVFGAVVVDLEPAVVDEAGERRPVAERVARSPPVSDPAKR